MPDSPEKAVAVVRVEHIFNKIHTFHKPLCISMCSLWCCCDFVIFPHSGHTIFGVL